MRGNTIAFTDPPQPYWTASSGTTDYPALKGDLEIDVAVVGGGLAGITTAYLLKQSNLAVAVIEAGRIGQGTSGHTTAKVTSQHSLIYDRLIKNLGPERARQYAEANEHAITFIEDLINKNKIDCDFSRQSAYVYTREEQYVKQIEDEVRAASSLGIGAHFQEQIPLPFDVKAAERFDNQAQFHPRKYLLALAAKIPGGGSHIFERTRCVDFHEGAPFTIITAAGHRVIAAKVVFASHFPVYGGDGYYYARIYPERAYAVAVTAEEKFPGGIYISAEKPGRSLRSTPYKGSELIIVTGDSHRTGQGPPTGTHYRNLAQFAGQTFTVTGMPFRWSAQDYTTPDEVPYAGYLAPGLPNVYVATGFRKWGMTNATASSILLKDLIVRGESPWKEVYDPARFKADPLIKQSAATGTAPIKEPPAAAVKSEKAPRGEDLIPGEAAVIEDDSVGLYRDEAGQVHAVELICTHMGCEPVWNEAERSWDCPCHGSRFTYEGDIIEGPALKPLRTRGDRFNP